MPAFTPPDPARQIAKLAADLERVQNTVRRGKPAAHMRDLRDAELFDAEEGQVPVYDASIGKWRPGSAGGVSYALYSGTFTSATHNNSTIVPWDTLAEDVGSHGITLTDPAGPTPGRFTLPPGLYTVAAHIFFAPNATGFREIHFSGTVPIAGNGALSIVPPKHRTAAVAAADEGTDVTLTYPIRSATGEDVLWVYGLQTSGGAINVTGRSITFTRHS